MEVVRVHVLGLFPMIVSLAVELFCKTIHEVPFFFQSKHLLSFAFGVILQQLTLIQVVNLLKNEGIEWREENQGTVLIRLDGPKEFSFLDSGSDGDSD